ncbi:terminase large subunit [Mucilaginibacter sp. RS28]|uniref:Terminase large subunit n=1 Tax=Mucilaginibacter straminoryzae TaxID=2932774 RepID=A0A9X1X096_9SPHI|nr:terminase large subunit [Mucilaginibacter straminoryzae]MCJ8208673.1 terminase large subunit [Mucilaginibacter straminoryzae]
MFKTTILFKANYHSKAHVVINQGGTSSGKTYAILQVLFCLACEQAGQVITVAGQDIPNLKAGALRDALNIWQTSPALQPHIKGYNKTDRVFEFHNSSVLEFKSYDNAQDAKSGKRDYLFVNEANGVSWAVYTELSLRTAKRIFIDYNPNIAFWVHEHLHNQPSVELIISDHRHNPFLDEDFRKKIESLKETDTELWKVYARGLTGRLSGLVFNNWFTCAEIPSEAKRIAYGLDFGFTNDETGLVEVFLHNGELWVNELIYQTGLTNQDIARQFTNLGVSKAVDIIADSAEPKSIEELRRQGWPVVAASKGADSIKNSIDILKRYRINVTQGSSNLRKELSRYLWKTDQTGKTINQPVDAWNHLIDPLRYVALKKLAKAVPGKLKSRLPWQNNAFNTVSEALKVL